MILAGLKRILHLWHGPRVADKGSTVILDPMQPLFFCHVCKIEKPVSVSVYGHGHPAIQGWLSTSGCP